MTDSEADRIGRFKASLLAIRIDSVDIGSLEQEVVIANRRSITLVFRNSGTRFSFSAIYAKLEFKGKIAFAAIAQDSLFFTFFEAFPDWNKKVRIVQRLRCIHKIPDRRYR